MHSGMISCVPTPFRLAGRLASVFILLLTLALQAASPTPHQVPMRDGTELATDVYQPEGDGPWPVILLRFPYNKALGAGLGTEATKRGFVFVAQDTRGRFASEGANLPFDADGHADGQYDGYDTAAWIAQQAWSNGKLGTWGGSAGAITQYFLAGTGPTNLVSQHLTVGTASLFRESIYRGGIFRQAMTEDWLKGTKFATNALNLWTTNYPLTQYWKEREIVGLYGQVNAAGLHIGGWFDIFAQATVDAFQGYQNEGGPGARGRQKLIMGPWTHGVLQDKAGDLVFPGAKKVPGDLHDAWKWFATTLKGENNGLTEAPAITYYVMGAAGEDGAPGNVWRMAARWPIDDTQPRVLHLRTDRTSAFDEAGPSGTLTYTNDPAHPVPSVGGYELTIPAGPKDQRSIESRPDLLVFTTAPLTAPLEVTGHVLARLQVRCDVPDADLIVRLCDVYPDGKSMNICEGALRLRFRDGFEQEKWLAKDKTVTVTIQAWPTSMIFNRGHRIRVHVASSSAPALEPNRQNAQPPRTGEPRPGTITVLVGNDGSHLVLPVAAQD